MTTDICLPHLQLLIDRLAAAPDKAASRARQQAVWRGEPVDRLPLLFSVSVDGLEDVPRFNLEECYYDPAKMLYEHVIAMLGVAESSSDSLPSMRANFGTATLATVFGLEQRIFPDMMPWLDEHLPKETIAALTPDDLEPIEEKGVMPQVLACIRFFREHLGESAGVYLSDTQGPFDLAHLVRGDDLFTDLYDDPAFVHHLLELVTQVYVRASTVMKEAVGEPLDGGLHGNGLVMANGGVRLCEDSSTLLSPKLIDEFVAPYTERALQPFGGGWVHYCGRNDHLLTAILDLPSVHGLNFGNPDYHNPAEVLPEILRRGKVYTGACERRDGETLETYFRRCLAPMDGHPRGLILWPSLTGEELKDPQRVLDLWARLQS